MEAVLDENRWAHANGLALMEVGLVEGFEELVGDGLLPELALLEVCELAVHAGADERREASAVLGVDLSDDLAPELRVGGGCVP